MATKLYSKGDIQRHLDFETALDIVERTYVETAQGRVLNPSKLTMHMGDDGEWPDLNAFSIDMPAYVDWLGVAGMKWAVATWNADTDVPISSQILLFDLERGEFKSVLEGMYITGVRTALQTVVGLEHLSAEDPDSIGVFGAGYQARFQLRVIDSLVDVDRFTVFDVDAEAARELVAEQAAEVDADLVVADGPEAATDSDAIVTVTDSKTPVLEEDWLDESAFIVALGSYQELQDETILTADHIVVDHTEQCLQRGALSDIADRGRLSESDLDATIGTVLDGEYPETVRPDDRIVFVPIGLGSLDVSIAEYLHEEAIESDVSQEFAFV